MSDIIRIVFINLLLFPIVVYRNWCFSIQLMYGEARLRSEHLEKCSFSIKSMGSKACKLGVLFRVLTVLPTLFMLAFLTVFSLIKIAKVIFGWEFIWLSTDFLVLLGFGSMGYSVLMIIIFGFVSWIHKTK